MVNLLPWFRPGWPAPDVSSMGPEEQWLWHSLQQELFSTLAKERPRFGSICRCPKVSLLTSGHSFCSFTSKWWGEEFARPRFHVGLT